MSALIDLDRKLTQESRPDGTLLQHAYDSAGRLNATTAPTGTLQRLYYAAGETCPGCAPGQLAALICHANAKAPLG